MSIAFHRAALAFFLISGLSQMLIRAEVVLFDKGVDPSPIYYFAKSDPLEESAAKQLAEYASKITGVKFTAIPIERDKALPDRAVMISALEPDAASSLGPDSFRITARGQRLLIVGGNARGAMFGVFALLEKHLGCRWWSYNEEDIPTGLTRLAVPECDETTRPAFSIHNVWNIEAQTPQNRFAYKLRSTSSASFDGGHTLYPLLQPYGEKHPEIYPQDNTGARKPNDLHFCYLAPGIAEALADAISAKIAARKTPGNGVIEFAGMGDWYGGQCQCDACKKAYEEEAWTDPDGRRKPGYTGTLLRMINRTAELLEAKYPGIRLGTFAYMSLEAPPGKTVPRHNVVIRVPRLRHCGVHSVRSCENNASFARNVERWAELAPGRVYVWEYGACYTNLLGPYPCLNSMADNLRWYHEHGVAGVEIQGNYVSTGGDLAALKNYVWAKLMWNPNLDPHKLVDDFCRGYYGPAADAMERYVDLLERSVIEPKPLHADEFNSFMYLTPDVRAKAQKLKAEALGAAGDSIPYTRRVREAMVSIAAVDLWKPAALVERDGRLVRADSQGDTLAQATELLQDIRGGTPSEYGTPASAKLKYLALQGGPLVTLAGGDVEAKVAPLLNGQIRLISFRGQPLLYLETKPQTRGYPFIGGSFENFPLRVTELDGQPSANSMREKGEEATGLFTPRAKSWIARTLEMTPAGVLRTSTTLHYAPTKADSKKPPVTATTYALGTGQPPHVETAGAKGIWQAVIFAADGAPSEVKDVKALRIFFPKQSCVVEDKYLEPVMGKATITYDPKAGTLRIVVETTGFDSPLKGDRPWLVRELSVAGGH